MKVTISDVALKAQVSKTTVSRILNGNFAHTTEETKNRVLKAIEELDYRPNALAKGLKLMKTNVIGIILSNLKNPFWITVLEGVEDASHQLGFQLMICNTNEDQAKEEEYIKEFQRRQVDGIIINPTVKNLKLYEDTIQKMPVVFINRRIPIKNSIQVGVDNVQGASLAVNHLIRIGRKNIAAFAFNTSIVSPWIDRLEGYERTLSANGFISEDMKILKLEEKNGQLNEAIKEYLNQNQDIDAIFSTNNMITLEIFNAVKELGLSIPKDIAVISYDETVWAKFMDPPLSTVKQPGYEMGKLAVENLIYSIDQKDPPKERQIILKPELVPRVSCGLIQSK